jgi:hypothetical protein
VSRSPTLRRLGEELLLFRFADRSLDVMATVAVALLVGWSRFGLLANGPWEWDEAIFARGILDFNLAAHFPHPPGFPGWLAIGHLLMPLAGEPLTALQWGSAALSVVALWPLAALGRRVAPPVVAVAAAVVVLFAPGPWLHAVRGFSSTPAATLALLAGAVAVSGVEGRRLTLFTVLVSAAFLVRPILLPGLAVLWLGVAVGVRPVRRLLPGVSLGLGLVVVAVVLMAVAEGGWAAFVEPFLRHSDRHFSRLVRNPEGWTQLGLVKGLGGAAWAAALLALAAAGLAVWARRTGARAALLWLTVLGVTLAQLTVLQNRTYVRYAVPVQLALGPLIAGSAAMAPPVVAAIGLATAAGVLGARSYSLVAEQHTTALPGWQAVRFAADEAAARTHAVVVEPELYPFASYHWHVMAQQGLRPPPLVLSPWAPEPWRGVDRPYLVATVHRHHYLDSPVGDDVVWGGVSSTLRPHTQQRFLDAWVILNPPLPVGRWWPVEVDPRGRSFMWGGPECDLVLPPMPESTEVEAAFRPAPGEAPLEVEWNGQPLAEFEVTDGRFRLRVDAERVRDDRANRMSFRRAQGYPPGEHDRRPLAVQLLGVQLRGPFLPWRGSLVSAEQRAAIGARLVGHHLPELFGDHGPGVWLEPRSRLEVTAGPGRLVMTMWAPRPDAPDTVVRLDGGTMVGPLELGPAPMEVSIPVADQDLEDGILVVELESVPYVPALAGHGDDRRTLGVVVSEVRFEPARLSEWARPFEPAS